MISLRFFQSATLAVSTALFGAACNSTGDASAQTQETSPAGSTSFVSRDWNTLVAGCSLLPADVEASVRSAVTEDNLANNPRTAIEERVPGTVSMERHQRQARAHYQQALNLLPSEECPVVRRRLQGRVSMLGISIDSLERINGRFSLGE